MRRLTTRRRWRRRASARRARRARVGRAGTSLAELMVSLIVFGVVAAAAAAALARQERFARESRARAFGRDRLREGIAVVVRAVQGAAPADVRVEGDTAFAVSATLGGGIVCDIAGAEIRLPLPPADDAVPLAAWSSAPDAGDSLHLLLPDEGGSAARVWSDGPVASAGAADSGCPSPWPAAAALRVTLASPPPPGLPRSGLAARLTRALRFRCYRAADAGWYLGAATWNAAGAEWTATQPVSGPYLSPARGGCRFTLVDGAGAAVPPGDSSAAGMGVTFAAELTGIPPVAGAPGAWRAESLATVIAFRNHS